MAQFWSWFRFVFIIFQLFAWSTCLSVTKTNENIEPIQRSITQALTIPPVSRASDASMATVPNLATGSIYNNNNESTTAGSESQTTQTTDFVIPGRDLIINPVGLYISSAYVAVFIAFAAWGGYYKYKLRKEYRLQSKATKGAIGRSGLKRGRSALLR
jgi:hypothetical protein